MGEAMNVKVLIPFLLLVALCVFVGFVIGQGHPREGLKVLYYEYGTYAGVKELITG